eukprot:Polyplicarium_translucidae@DN2848_c0_g1_i1.p1
MVVLYFVQRFLEEAQTSFEIKYLMSQRRLVVVPFVNPDGYFAIEETGNDAIRKNRRPTCPLARRPNLAGVDLNRNYGTNFKKYHSVCDAEEYEGAGPFSEPETQCIRDIVVNYKPKSAMNFHAFGGFWTHPWNCCKDKLLDEESQHVYDEIKRDINVTEFNSAPSLQFLNYETSGEADDWMYAEHGVIAMSPEVGDKKYGFWPPVEKSLEFGEANYARILHVIKKSGVELRANVKKSGSTILLSVDNTGLAHAICADGDRGELIVFWDWNLNADPVVAQRQPAVATASAAATSEEALVVRMGSLPPRSSQAFELRFDRNDASTEFLSAAGSWSACVVGLWAAESAVDAANSAPADTCFCGSFGGDNASDLEAALELEKDEPGSRCGRALSGIAAGVATQTLVIGSRNFSWLAIFLALFEALGLVSACVIGIYFLRDCAWIEKEPEGAAEASSFKEWWCRLKDRTRWLWRRMPGSEETGFTLLNDLEDSATPARGSPVVGAPDSDQDSGSGDIELYEIIGLPERSRLLEAI